MDSPGFRLRLSYRLAAACFVPFTIGQAAESLESMQKTVAELSRVRAETARLESEWQWQHQTLAGTVEALTLRAETLAQDQSVLEARRAARQQEIQDLTAQAGAARARLQDADHHLRAIAGELLAMRAWLPPRLSRALELPYRSLADPTLAPGERMQHIVTIATRCSQFNGVITCDTETLALAGQASPRLLDVIYWGLSHGYAFDRVRQVAYVGRPAADGWTWREEPAIAAAVAKLIAIHRDQTDPEFVPVPMQVSDPFAAASR